MSTTITTASSAEHIKLHNSKPSFFGIVSGELLKVTRLWITWIMLVLWLGAMTFPYIIQVTTDNTKQSLHTDALKFFYQQMSLNLTIFRVFTGIFLLVITAYVIGQEYQLGTIRILLARGVGRLQLLFAKLLSIICIALLLFVVGIVLNGILLSLLITIVDGNLNSLHLATPEFWSNTELYMLTVLISMGVTILLATGLSILGRSLALGLSASLAWFAVDNIGSLFMMIGYRVTHNDLWLKVTAYFLGPNLNVMPGVVVPAKPGIETIGFAPLVKVDGPHTLWVALVYAVIFSVVALVLMWRRDVKE